MSRAGRVLALGALLCALAGCFAISSLYVPGVALALIALAAELSVRLAQSRACVRIELDAATVEEGSSVRIELAAWGWPRACRRPQLRASPAAPWRELSQREPLALSVRPARRGEYPVGPAALRFSDPFGICVRERASAPARLLVLPIVERVERVQLERLAGAGQATPREEGGSGVSGVRRYRIGAPASRIHWLSVARRGELFERSFEGDAGEAAITVAFDTRAPASADALDMAARAAASLCVGLAGLGGCALLLPGWPAAHPLRADLSSWPRLHAQLALAGPGQELDRAALGRARLLVLVAARRVTAEAAAGASCVVSPLPADGPVLFTVAGCAAQRAGRAAERAA